MKNESMKMFLPLVLVAVVFGGGGFYGGLSYQKTKTAASASAQGGFYGGQGFRGGAGGGRQGRFGAGGFVGGTVLSKDDKSITVQLRSGGSQTVYYSSSTTVSKPTDATIDEVSVGDQVTAMGTPNSDGSVTATSIQVRPPMPPGSEGGAAPPAPQNVNR